MIDDQQARLEDVISGPMVNVEMTGDHVDREDIRSGPTRRPLGEAKAAAAQERLDALNERRRWIALRYTARSVIVDA